MTSCCPACGQLLPQADPVEQLREACRSRGVWLSYDDRVREADAADLIGLTVKTLRNRRYQDAPLPFVMRLGRPLYALTDLAAFMAGGGE